MKPLHFALVLVFSIVLTEAKSSPWLTEKLKTMEKNERTAYEADEEGLTPAVRNGQISCLGPWGYCLLRNKQCTSRLVMKERFNNCPNTRTLKCCVL